MNRIRKAVAAVTLGVAGGAVVYVGNGLVQDVKFARADETVQAARQDLQKAEDLASAYKAVGKAVDPSVVKIEVRKTIRGVARRPDEDFFRHFFPNGGQGFGQQGQGQGQGQGNGQGQNDNGQDQPDNGDNSAGPNAVPQEPEETGEGSGVIMDASDGYAYILTNNHVAGGASELTVTLSNGDIVKNAKLLGADPKSDLAVVQIKADHLIAAKWGDSDLLEKGDLILAFGAPFDYVGSMTHGIVSALNRTDVGIIDRASQFRYENFIQVDAPINPGNSGGPLVNLHAEVVGINTAIASRSGGFQGIGFAIPSNEAHPIYTALKDKGRVTRGWLGVGIRDVKDYMEAAKANGFTGSDGVFVSDTFNNTPASGKLMPGDVITQLDGKPVKTTLALRNAIAADAPHTDVTLHVVRHGKETDVKVKLGEQPDDQTFAAGRSRHTPDENTATADTLGLQMANVSDALTNKFGLSDVKSGAIVTKVDPNSPAAQAGISPGDLITKVGDKEVTDADSAADALGKSDANKGVALNITNREGSRFVFIKSQK